MIVKRRTQGPGAVSDNSFPWAPHILDGGASFTKWIFFQILLMFLSRHFKDQLGFKLVKWAVEVLVRSVTFLNKVRAPRCQWESPWRASLGGGSGLRGGGGRG